MNQSFGKDIYDPNPHRPKIAKNSQGSPWEIFKLLCSQGSIKVND